MDLLDALSRTDRIRHITTRHEQGAAFMADVHGRLTGRAAVAMATLGPGATNLVTGVADAFLDRAPMVALTGQAALGKVHKESHQYVDIVRLFGPITKWNQRVERPATIPEIVRKAFRVAQLSKPGPTHIELPEDIAATKLGPTEELRPLVPGGVYFPEPTQEAVDHAARLLAASSRPLVLAGNGVLRRHASGALRALANGLHVPVAVTFMGKGAMDDRSHLSLMAVGLQARDHVLTGFDRADLVIAVGYDLVEYAPSRWNPDGTKRIIHIDTQPAEVDQGYQPEVELIGDIEGSLERLLAAVLPTGISGRDASARHAAKETLVNADLRQELLADLGAYADRRWLAHQAATGHRRLAPRARPVRHRGQRRGGPQDLGRPAVPGLRTQHGHHLQRLRRRWASRCPARSPPSSSHPERRVVALSGDGGFLMNAQELETAKRVGANVTVVVWRDDGYGLIDWKQRNEFGRPFAVDFGNPDFVAFAESFGIAGFRPRSSADLYPTLMRALAVDGPSLVEVPIDYRENLRLTEHLGALATDG